MKVALRLEDAALRERLRAAVGRHDDLELAGEADPAEVAIADEAGLSGLPKGAPVVLLGEADGQPADSIAATLPEALDPENILAAARLVTLGLTVRPRERPRDADSAGPPVPQPQLTAREKEVLELLVGGASNKEIARRLDISVHTVKFHISAILLKLGASGRLDAVGMALRSGLVML